MQILFAVFRGFVEFGITLEQGLDSVVGLRDGAQSGRGQFVGTQGAVFLSLLLVDLAEMIAHLAVLSQAPRRGNIFFRLVEIAFAEIDPAQRVPVRNKRRNQRQLLWRKAVERHIAQGRGRS